MEFSSPFTTNSSKLSAMTDFLFLRKTSQALYNGMMKNKRATDPRNGIQMAASCSSGILKTMYRWPMATKSRGCIPGVWSVRFQNQTMSPPRAPKKLSKMYHSPRVPGGQPPGKPTISALPYIYVGLFSLVTTFQIITGSSAFRLG